MLVSMPGVDPSTGQPRLTFDYYMLNSGLKLLPVLIGVFAVSQIIADIVDLDRKTERVEMSRKGILMSLADWKDAGLQPDPLLGDRHLGRHPARRRRLDRLGARLHRRQEHVEDAARTSARARRRASSPPRPPTTPPSAAR